MSRPRTWSRRTSAGLLASVVAAGAMTLAGATTASANPPGETDVPKTTPVETLGSHDAKLLNDAEAKGEPTVTLIVATDKARTKDVAAALGKLGGKISRRYDSVGYLLATVPTAQALKAAKLPGVTAVDLNDVVQLPDPRPAGKPGTGATAKAQAPAVKAPGADTPAANPFMPTNETGAVSFKQQHPAWDGRGVTIGIMDSGVDLDSPALQKTTTGERKITDWFTATDPLEDSAWRPMLTEVTGPTFSAAGATWTAPAGTWRFNRFSESITIADDAAGDVNRDGDTTDTWGILYNPVNHDIRVDVNQNRDFTDDAVMRPYREKYDIGHFGTDNPATAVREQMPFVVEYREDVDTTPAGGPGLVDYVNIGILESEHGTHVAGITAANDMFGNSVFDGAAPGAKLVSARACSWGGGCTYAALTTGMVELVVNRKVDVVNVSIGGLPALNDGADARATLYNRLINDYGVQLFISDGNDGPGVNTTGDPATASDVVSVASSISKESWLANYGAVVRTPYQLHNFSSRGPREDGGFKPNITAPGSAISTTPVFLPGGPVAEAGYALPPGYSMLQGTSMAAPQATGSAALLLSAAKANDLGVTPAALRRAIYSSATWIDGAPAHAQGNGLLNVNGAWKLLAKGVETRDYSVDAPVCSPLDEQLSTPGRGTGIYNRCAAGDGGQKPGVAKTYAVKITRTSGPKGNVKHSLSWVGNDGTFRGAPKSVTLPLGKTVTVTVEAKAGVGAHSAILRVDDPKTNAVDFEILNTVVVGETPKHPDYSFAADGSVERNGFTSYFVTVPQGAKALQVNLSRIATGSQVRFIAINPYGLHVESTASTACFTNYSDAAACKPQERDYQNPIPGIWEIEVEARRTTPALDNPFRLSAEIQGVSVNPAVVDLASVSAGVPTPLTWSLKNDFGPATVTTKGGALSSASTARPTIVEHTTQEYTVNVPAGATSLTAVIGNPANLGADLDLYVYLGTAEVGRSADGDSEEAVTLANPAPGTYRVVVDGYNVDGSGGSTQYDYRDSFTAPSLGSVTTSTGTFDLANGATATATGAVTANAAPAAGRTLYGELSVVTDQGAVVGQGAVSIRAVS
ncbi:S8 family serine peptidase [Micromonospora sp. NPDC049559]|uniref:S8 family serine peptidase n=1 Tax=Micromonospora sp. NPDC049559 TaxID=3155923 RepID=UPI003429B3DF